MARARNIKPGFFQNDQMAELDPLARLLFIGMWTIADFKGCLEYRPKRIKAQVLPYDDCDVAKLTINLDKSGFLSIYSAAGQPYIKIINFERHQNPHKNERESGSEIPDIDKKDSEISELTQDGTTPDKNGTAPADSLLLIPDSLNPLTDSLIPDSKPFAAKLRLSPPEKKEPKPKSVSSETWEAYSGAYFFRYGTEPVRNASVNGKLAQFVQRIGAHESPNVARFFLSHNNGYYVRAMHSVGAMLQDAEKLRTEWATNTRMTQTKALQADKTATNLDAFAPLIAAAKAREEAERNDHAEQ